MTRAGHELTIGPNEAGQRLDRFLRKLLADSSRAEIYRALRTKKIRVNGGRGDPAQRLAEGDRVSLPSAPSAAKAAPRPVAPDAPPLRVVYQDEHLLVVDKDAGMLVHAGDPHDGAAADAPTLVDAVAAFLAAHGHEIASPTFRPGPVHRLDRNTSGLVVFALSLPASQALAAAWRDRQVDKRYLALVEGAALPSEGVIDLPLSRDDRTTRAGDGDAARTRYRVTARTGERQLVELWLDTGRTHQLRAHLAAAGAPILGDQRYGDAERNRRARRELGCSAKRCTRLP